MASNPDVEVPRHDSTGRLLFYEREHRYVLDGLIDLPGSTACARAAGLIEPFADPEAAERKGLIGSELHYCATLLEENDLDMSTVDPTVLGYLRGVERFLERERVTLVSANLLVFSEELKVAGEIDRIYDHPIHGLAIFDWKVSYSLLPYYGVQQALYTIAESERSGRGDTCLPRFLVKLTEKGNYKIHPVNEPKWIDYARAAAGTYWMQRDLLRKKKETK